MNAKRIYYDPGMESMGDLCSCLGIGEGRCDELTIEFNDLQSGHKPPPPVARGSIQQAVFDLATNAQEGVYLGFLTGIVSATGLEPLELEEDDEV